MEQVAARVPEGTNAGIEAYADENGISKSEAIREVLANGLEYDELQSENARLRSEKRTIINQREEHGELVEYVEEERKMQRRREEREQRREERRQANVATRLWWWLSGAPADDETA